MFHNIKPAQRPACLPPAEGRRALPLHAPRMDSLKAALKTPKWKRTEDCPATLLRELHWKAEGNWKFSLPMHLLRWLFAHFLTFFREVSEGATGCDTDTTCTRCERRQKSGWAEWSPDRLALNWLSTDICCQTHSAPFPIKMFSRRKKIHTHIYIDTSYFPFSSFIKLWFEDIYIFYSDMSEAEWQVNEPGNFSPMLWKSPVIKPGVLNEMNSHCLRRNSRKKKKKSSLWF